MGYSPNTVLETHTVYICVNMKNGVVSFSFLNSLSFQIFTKGFQMGHSPNTVLETHSFHICIDKELSGFIFLS